ncbi:MAG: non-ribosomal peptide synthetase [Nostoc sp. NMS7]|uniref:condensation domain-containing protein n=1 Tax=Nostoc sp. NMS7 TaxID=2815391 RepID=UPI0025FA2FF0|nr:condensation domain-containing protein [Nostoc sp. NMS7]MBN3951424.1 non-ribosomal peptide synthetase [Nostoc sp. NMS7]
MKTENIEDIYELSPIEKGILFHSLYTPEFGIYFFQMPFVFRGHLNLTAFEQAWQQVIERHTILRTGFYWEDINKPQQVVYRQVRVPLEQQDWRDIDLESQQEQLKSFLESDRKRGFDLSQECLMRLTLICLSEDFYQFIWSRHFLIIDGWSVPLVLKEFVQLYEGLCQGENVSLVPSIPYRKYIDWLQKQDIASAETFWRQTLSGLKTPTFLKYLDVENLSSQKEIYEEQRIYLSPATTDALQSLARQHHLTLSTLFQGAWAILLSRYSCENQVVYGCTVAGRPIELVTEEPIIGLFVNTLPVWVNVNPEQSLLVWLKQLQEQLVEMRQYEWTPLVDIQGWSEVPRSLPLFESILVYENAPIDRVLRDWQGSLEVENATIFSNSSSFYKTNYPIAIAVYPGSNFCIGIDYDFRRFDTATITGILQHFEILLQDIVTHPEANLKDLSLLTSKQQHLASKLEKEVAFNFV